MPGVLTLFGRTLAELRIKHIRTQVNSPWTNGKIERFWGVLQAELLDRELLPTPAAAEVFGAAAVIATLAETKRLDLKTNAAARGTQLYEGVLKLAEKHDIIGDVRGGHGLMTGIEIVSDRAAKTPMDAGTMKRIHKAAYEAGAMVRLGAHNILMSPPLTITADEIDVILAALDAGFAAA